MALERQLSQTTLVMSKRRAPRIPAAIGAIVSQGDTREPCLTSSLSVTGLALASKRRWRGREKVTVDLVEEGFRLTTTARVVRQEKDQLYLGFDAPGPTIQRMIKDLMTALIARTGASPSKVDLSDFKNIEGKVKWAETQRRSFNPFARGFRNARVADISQEGAFLLARRVPEVDAKLVIVLEDNRATDHGLRVEATAVRYAPGGFAVKLHEPSHDVRRWISKLRSFQRL